MNTKVALLDNSGIMISNEEEKLLALLREINHGHVTIFKQDGRITRIVEVSKSTKL